MKEHLLNLGVGLAFCAGALVFAGVLITLIYLIYILISKIGVLAVVIMGGLLMAYFIGKDLREGY